MGRQEGPLRPELTPNQRQTFIERIEELLPELVPNYAGVEIDDRNNISFDDDSTSGLVINEAEAEHDLGEEHFQLERTEYEGHEKVEVRSFEHKRPTDEDIYLGISQTYKVQDGRPSYRKGFSVFRGGNVITVDQLLVIYNRSYIQPVLDEYARLLAESQEPDTEIFTAGRLFEILSKLDRLGPGTLSDPLV